MVKIWQNARDSTDFSTGKTTRKSSDDFHRLWQIEAQDGEVHEMGEGFTSPKWCLRNNENGNWKMDEHGL